MIRPLPRTIPCGDGFPRRGSCSTKIWAENAPRARLSTTPETARQCQSCWGEPCRSPDARPNPRWHPTAISCSPRSRQDLRDNSARSSRAIHCRMSPLMPSSPAPRPAASGPRSPGRRSGSFRHLRDGQQAVPLVRNYRKVIIWLISLNLPARRRQATAESGVTCLLTTVMAGVRHAAPALP